MLNIKNDRIVDIGNLVAATAKKVINADGLIVSPGFIDIHTHTDLGILTNINHSSAAVSDSSIEFSI